MKKSICLLLFLFCILSAKSFTVITAISDGKWSQASRWDLGRIPTCGDSVVIPAGITIAISGGQQN